VQYQGMINGIDHNEGKCQVAITRFISDGKYSYSNRHNISSALSKQEKCEKHSQSFYSYSLKESIHDFH